MMKVLLVCQNEADMREMYATFHRLRRVLAATNQFIAVATSVDEETASGLRTVEQAFVNFTHTMVSIYPHPEVVKRDERGLATIHLSIRVDGGTA